MKQSNTPEIRALRNYASENGFGLVEGYLDGKKKFFIFESRVFGCFGCPHKMGVTTSVTATYDLLKNTLIPKREAAIKERGIRIVR